jgi:two-component system sensor histidine kinase ChvG
MNEESRYRRGRRRSPITRRILAINLLALVILVAGLLYLGEYRRSLIAAELAALRTHAEMFAAALGEGAVATNSATEQRLVHDIAHQMVRRLVATTGTRARLFNVKGTLVSDSRLLIGPGGMVQIEELPPLETGGALVGAVLDFYDRLVKNLLGDEGAMPLYHEKALQRAPDYPEVLKALTGEHIGTVRRTGRHGMVLSVAVPVQRYKQVLGALLLSKGSRDIDAILFQVRLDILKAFAVALAVTVALSLYLAGTIARPVRRLAAAAERVRRSHSRQHRIPDFAGRSDEIGELAMSLSDMTEALWQRMDAIERFAADVAHEIKNPLTSLRSAVETAARLDDPEQQRRLMAIIKEDVQRLDRLISDISDASRLDAELSRAELAPVDLGKMLTTLVDVYRTTDTDGLEFRLEQSGELIVTGVEGRLAQVIRNLIANAGSFSPPGGLIAITATRDRDWIEVTVDDQGPGLPDGKEEAIFDRFYSERPEKEKFGTHSGLGLSISKQIIEAHGGTISAENRSREGGTVGGARFVIRLPAA